MKYDFKLRLIAEELQDGNHQLHLGIVCHKCNCVVYTNRLITEPDFAILANTGLANELLGHECE